MITPAQLEERLAPPSFTQDPYPAYRDLREHDPVHWSERWGVWVLTRYADCLAVLRDHERFSNAGRFSALLDQLPADMQAEVEPIRRHYATGLIQSDPPDHTRLRALIRQAFTPRAVDHYRETIRKIVGDLLAPAFERGGLDVVADLALVLPVLVICDLLGAPRVDVAWMSRVTRGLADLQATGGADPAHARRAAVAVAEVEAFFSEVVDDHRRRPREDLIDLLIEAHDEGRRLDRDELITTCVTLALAGHDTTKNLIANGTLALLEHPDQLERLRAEPRLMPGAVEESLRFDSPIQRAWRRAAVDTGIEGRAVATGQLVYLMLGSANRDGERFADPDRFDIERADPRHLAFGYGIHFCVGAPLARLEASEALAALCALPGLALAEEHITWLESVHLRCPTRLRVSFDAPAGAMAAAD